MTHLRVTELKEGKNYKPSCTFLLGPVSKMEKIIFSHLWRKYDPICYLGCDRGDEAAMYVFTQKNANSLWWRETIWKHRLSFSDATLQFFQKYAFPP